METGGGGSLCMVGMGWNVRELVLRGEMLSTLIKIDKQFGQIFKYA